MQVLRAQTSAIHKLAETMAAYNPKLFIGAENAAMFNVLRIDLMVRAQDYSIVQAMAPATAHTSWDEFLSMTRQMKDQ